MRAADLAGLAATLESGRRFGVRSVGPTGSLKVLDSLAAETKNPKGAKSIILQHILPTTVEFIEQVNRVWPVQLVVSIPYSNSESTTAALRARGFEVLVPPSIDYMKAELWRDVARAAEGAGAPVIYHEVGGYMARHTAELASVPGFVGCVEDTKNGLWAYQAAAKDAPLALPVLSMADTALKQVEDSLIGDACVYSLEKVLRTQLASILDGLRCGVIGWGHIGKSCARAFEGRNAVVSVYDINPVVSMLAYGRGFYPMPLKQLLAESDIVMGASGRRSVRVADIHDIKEGAFLCSASSKDVEFDLKGFAALCDIEDLTPPGAGLCPVERYRVRETGKSFYVLCRGTPIDFLDMPLQGAVLDCTFSELFVCMRELAERPHAPGLLELADDLQVAVAQRWLPAYVDAFRQCEDRTDKTFHFPESWGWE